MAMSSDAPVPSGRRPGKQEKSDGEAEGVNWKELVVDKAIDFVLIFVSLYAALTVDGWQDAAKEKEAYYALLDNFKTEMHWNQKQREALEKELGPVAETASGKALGPLQKHFDAFRGQTHDAEKLLDCLSDEISIAKKTTPTEADRKRLEECRPTVSEAEKATVSDSEKESNEKFKPLNLAPFYRAEVWQLYLSVGVKTFENKNLAVKIGSAYSRAEQIQRSADDIEKVYNESFIQKTGEIAAMEADLEESIPDGVDWKTQGDAVQQKLASSSRDMRAHHFAVFKTQNELELKVVALKTLLVDMDKLLVEIVGDIEKEQAKKGQ